MVKLIGLPAQGIIDGFKGQTDFYVYMGIPCARSWPRPPSGPRSLPVQGTWPAFSYINRIAASLPASIIQAYKDMATGSNAHWKDYLCRAYIMGIAGIARLNPMPQIPSITQYFLIKQIDQYKLPTGWKIVMTTDTLCSMLLFWTDREPRKNFTYRRRRGVSILAMAEFGFVYTRQVWQREPSDSMTHTFYFLSMPPGQTRFFATIAWKTAWLMKSTSPIFHKTRDHGWQWPVIIETWDNPYILPPEMEPLFMERWSYPFPPSFTRLTLEPWDPPVEGPPDFTLLITESWAVFINPPPMVNLLTEPWDPPVQEPPPMTNIFLEEWTV
jgi:hypothetical protein